MSEVCAMAVKAEWVRIHIKRIPAEQALYMGKYLTREDRAPCLKGRRLWGCIRYLGMDQGQRRCV